MTPTILSVPVLAVAIFAIAMPVLRRLARGTSLEDLPPDWLSAFSTESYEPMAKLLNDEDFDFLARQPGFDLKLYRKLRRDRLKIFQMYLYRMIADFNRLHLSARLMLSHAGEDHSQVLSKLLILRLRFSVTILNAQFRYQLCRLGMTSLPVRALILQTEEMRQHVLAASALV